MFNSIANQASKLLKLTTKENENIKSKTKLLTITSGKGGVGKTTLASNIAFLLAKKNIKLHYLMQILV